MHSPKWHTAFYGIHQTLRCPFKLVDMSSHSRAMPVKVGVGWSDVVKKIGGFSARFFRGGAKNLGTTWEKLYLGPTLCESIVAIDWETAEISRRRKKEDITAVNQNSLSLHQWYFSNGNDYGNGNSWPGVNGKKTTNKFGNIFDVFIHPTTSCCCPLVFL